MEMQCPLWSSRKEIDSVTSQIDMGLKGRGGLLVSEFMVTPSLKTFITYIHKCHQNYNIAKFKHELKNDFFLWAISKTLKALISFIHKIYFFFFSSWQILQRTVSLMHVWKFVPAYDYFSFLSGQSGSRRHPTCTSGWAFSTATGRGVTTPSAMLCCPSTRSVLMCKNIAFLSLRCPWWVFCVVSCFWLYLPYSSF